MLHADVKMRQVAVLRANYDFWYGIAEADDRLEPGEEPSLNADGFRYYLLYDKWPDGTRFWPDGSALTEQDAKETAEKMLPSPVQWLAELPTPPPRSARSQTLPGVPPHVSRFASGTGRTGACQE